jgi:PII-like signaling protein
MQLPDEAFLLRIYVGINDKHHGVPLYEAIVAKARTLNLAGATVLRGVLGYGASSRIHSAKLLDLSVDLPVVIEIVDTEEHIALLMPFIDAHVTEGLVTMEKVRVMGYRHRAVNPLQHPA